MDPVPQKPTHPTMYFIGVTTGSSSIMRVFPRWAKALGIDAVLAGIDLGIHAPPDDYRRVVDFIRREPLAAGALVTTHKIDLLAATRDMFHGLGPNATILSEVSSISKRDGRLWGHAKDPISSGLALEAFLPDDWWRGTGREALIFGAGGSALAISMYLTDPRHGDRRPDRLVVTNRSLPRLEEMEHIYQRLGRDVPCEYHRLEENDSVLAARPPGTLVINATGLGKDRPGSPVTDEAAFPQQSIAWDFNYRGDLKFLVQARSQQEDKQLIVQDGWIYFIHGWTQVIAEVFHTNIGRERIDELSHLAIEVR